MLFMEKTVLEIVLSPPPPGPQSAARNSLNRDGRRRSGRKQRFWRFFLVRLGSCEGCWRAGQGSARCPCLGWLMKSLLAWGGGKKRGGHRDRCSHFSPGSPSPVWAPGFEGSQGLGAVCAHQGGHKMGCEAGGEHSAKPPTPPFPLARGAAEPPARCSALASSSPALAEARG